MLVKIGFVEPGFKDAAHLGPFVIENRIPRGIAIMALKIMWL
jgi:hypothetical protein